MCCSRSVGFESLTLCHLNRYFHFRLARFHLNTSIFSPEPTVQDLPLNLKKAEDLLSQKALDQTGGNITASARLLGTNRPKIYKYFEQNNQTS